MYETVDDIIRANQEAGQHFFSDGALTFFDSRIHEGVYHGRFFVTSEQFHGLDGTSLPRKFTVREALENGHVDDASEFQEFDTLEDAQAAAEALSNDA